MTRRITVILNQGSGHDEKEEAKNRIQSRLEAGGADVRMVTIGGDDDISSACEKMTKDAKSENRIIVAAGGDGTVNTVAGLCLKHGATMGIIPMGTFNYFARELGIPADIDGAVDILLKGAPRATSVGEVNGHVFLNNASFGLYARMIRNREADKAKFGRYRLVALLSAMRSFLQDHRPLSLRLRGEAPEAPHRASMVMVGNCELQLRNLGLKTAELLRGDRLAVVLLKPVSKWETALLFLRGLTRTLGDATALEEFMAGDFTVDMKRPMVSVVIDGELVQMKTPLEFRALPEALQVVAPT